MLKSVFVLSSSPVVFVFAVLAVLAAASVAVVEARSHPSQRLQTSSKRVTSPLGYKSLFPSFSKSSPSPKLRKRSSLIGEKSDAQLVTECLTVTTEPGRYVFSSSGDETTCAVYVVGGAKHVVEIEFDRIDVSCAEGLVAFFDGWELNKKVFPNEFDHELPFGKRSTEMCNNKMGPLPKKLKFTSSQNAAQILYRVPQIGEGFSFTVKFLEIREPCNILMADMVGLFTLANFGASRNCSLTTLLFPANFQIEEMSIGSEGEQYEESCDASSSCSHGDFVEFGGNADLETADFLAKETLCGCDAAKMKSKGLTVLCSSSTVRLASSGRYKNKLTVLAKAAGEDDSDLDAMQNLILTCPEFI